MKLQKTIKREIKLPAGKGLFGGADVKVTFCPAPDNSGIVFMRIDGEEPARIEALVKNIGQRNRRTALVKGNAAIETVEHCLAAISALGVNNLVIEVEGPELPGYDGSSSEFCKALLAAELIEQKEPVKEYVISQSIRVTSGDATIYALPTSEEGFNITYDMDYSGHTGIGRQFFGCTVNPEGFIKNFSTARTFLLEAEAKLFQSRGLGKHLSPRDILVIDSDGPIKNSFRFPNECVRHKMVDLIGDLALVGRPIQGRIVAYKSGHALNQQMAWKLYEAAVKQERIAKYGTDAVLDIRRIQKILPHRYPFLLVDKVVEIEGNRRIKGIKNVSFNEQFFQGHFPGTPIMPGVLIVEALAQVSGLLFAQTLEHTGKLAVLLGMDSVKLRKAVVPGDQLVLISETVKAKKKLAICNCQALVGEIVVAEAEIKFMLVDEEQL